MNPDIVPDAPTFVSVLLTPQEQVVVYRALTMGSAMLDALGDVQCATSMLELAYRVLPGGNRE